MNKDQYQSMYELEDQHWWFSGKRNFIKTLLQQYCFSEIAVLRRNRLLNKSDSSIKLPLLMDIGCGTGKTMEDLSAFSRIVGCDFHDEAIRFCKKRGDSLLIQASAESLPVCENSFDIVCILGVLHNKGIKDDQRVLNEAFRILKPDGVLIVHEPAFNFLYSVHEKVQHVRQRYDKWEINEKLINAGFTVNRVGYYDFFLFPIVVFVRMVRKVVRVYSSQSDIFHTPKLLNRILKSILFCEANLLKTRNFPFGLSVFAVSRKPG
jgi:ubiquinone/menaquinone biosynthesis C-methylase UbiE